MFSSASRLGWSTGESCSQSGRKRPRRHSRNPHETTPAGMTARIRGCWWTTCTKWTTCTNWKIVLRTTRLSKCRRDGQSRPQSDDRDTIGCALSGLMHCLNKVCAVNSFKDFSRPLRQRGRTMVLLGARISSDGPHTFTQTPCHSSSTPLAVMRRNHTLSNPCSAASKDSAEHSQVEFTRPGLLEFEPRKVRVIRIQEHVTFASDG